ncbi:suppressor of fused domain protein [Dactylosporangium salmoneum]|uniref:Suppressor of fused-like domain-containing protein n=1 Tax=Dactylosporangium salmoneum TaxID=53361 RepID=A0ABN3GJ50_9ACTN
MSGLVEHLERLLGPIAAESTGDETTPAGVQVVWFGPDRPYPGVTTLATLGLHRYHLGGADRSGLHQELLFHVAMADESAAVAGILFQVAGMMVERGSGLQRGQVLGPAGPLFGEGDLTALYVTAPLYLPEESEIFRAPGQTW